MTIEFGIKLKYDGKEVGTGVAVSREQLEQLGEAGKNAGEQAAVGLKQAGSAAKQTADDIKSAFGKLRIRDSSSIVAEATQIRNALNQIKASGSLEDTARASAAAKAAIASLRLEFDGTVKSAQRLAIPSLAPNIAQMNQLGMSSKATAAALRGVPAQFTDIVTALQGGQAPLTVLLQQGGQLKDMFGGVGNAAKALGGYVLGLVNPATIAAAAGAALGLAYYQGAAEATAFNRTLILTGNVAATSSGQLQDMAYSIASSTGATRGAVAETLNEIVGTGKVSADMLGKVTQAAIDMERAGGAAASDTVKEFAALGDAPASAVLKLNEKYHFLTA